MRPLLALSVVLLLAACAERWVRPGATEAESEAMNETCGAEAFAAVPPVMVVQMTSPARIERDRQCWREGPNERCRVIERFRPAQYSPVDVAAGARDQHRRSCMQQKGFVFQGYRPLRLE